MRIQNLRDDEPVPDTFVVTGTANLLTTGEQDLSLVQSATKDRGTAVIDSPSLPDDKSVPYGPDKPLATEEELDANPNLAVGEFQRIWPHGGRGIKLSKEDRRSRAFEQGGSVDTNSVLPIHFSDFAVRQFEGIDRTGPGGKLVLKLLCETRRVMGSEEVTRIIKANKNGYPISVPE